GEMNVACLGRRRGGVRVAGRAAGPRQRGAPLLESPGAARQQHGKNDPLLHVSRTVQATQPNEDRVCAQTGKNCKKDSSGRAKIHKITGCGPGRRVVSAWWRRLGIFSGGTGRTCCASGKSFG